MKLVTINEAYFSQPWGEGDKLSLELLAQEVDADMESIFEGFDLAQATFNAPVLVKGLVKDTFDFVRKGNVFVFVGERTLTRATLQKLEDFYDNMKTLASSVNQEALTQLLNILKGYILYALVMGSAMMSNGMTSVHKFLMHYMVWTNTNGQKETDPITLMLLILLETNQPVAVWLAKKFGGAYDRTRSEVIDYQTNRPPVYSENYFAKAAATAAANFAADHLKHAWKSGRDAEGKEQLSISDEVAVESAKELAIQFKKLIKQNPRKAAKFLIEVYKMAPDEYEEAFWSSMRTGVKKTLVGRIRGLFLGMGKSFIGR